MPRFVTLNTRAAGAALVAPLACALAAAAPGFAQTLTWNTPAGGTWNTAGNWNPATVPNLSTHQAVFPAGGGTYVVTLNSSPSIAGVALDNVNATLELAGTTLTVLQPDGLSIGGVVQPAGSVGTVIGDIVITPGGRLQAPGGRSLFLRGPTVTDNGQILLNNTASAADALIRIDANVLLQGSGALRLATAGTAFDAQLSTNGSVLTQAAGHTIGGEGTINASLVNNGLIVGDVSGRSLLLTSVAKTNNGTIRATGGGNVTLSIGLTQGAGGVLEADGGSVSLAGGSAVTGGTLRTLNGGGITRTLSTGTLTDISNTGALDLAGGTSTFVTGSALTNTGTIRLNSDASATDALLRIDSPLLLTGSGALRLATAGTAFDAQLSTNGSVLTQSAGHTIGGEGTINASLVNNGLIVGDVSGRSLLLTSVAKTNNGTIRATGGGNVTLSIGLTQGAGGVLEADGGSVSLAGGSAVTGGTLRTLNGGGITRTLSTGTLTDISNTGALDLAGGTSTIVTGSALTNTGTIRLNSDASATDALLRIDSPLLLTGSGALRLATAGTAFDAQLSTNGSVLTQSAGHTIGGEGTINASLVNNGLVVADVAGRTLLLAAVAKTNAGTFSADGGVLSATVGITNNGIVEARNGGTFRAATLPAHVKPGALVGGSWRAYDNSTLRLIGATIDTLHAELVLHGPGSNIYRDDATASALAGFRWIHNDGRFVVEGGRTFGTAGGLTQRGWLEIGAGSRLDVPGTLTQTQGTTRVDGTLAPTGGAQNLGAILDGTGVVQGNLLNSGYLRPGHSVGTLTVSGSFQQTTSGGLEIEASGAAPGGCDRLNVSGTATLDGDILFTTLGGFVPAAGDSFTVLTYAARVGTFRGVIDRCAFPGICLQVVTFPTRVVVMAVSGSVTGVPTDPPGERPGAPRLLASSMPGGTPEFRLELPGPARVTLRVFDVQGRSLAVVREGDEAAGAHVYRWQPPGGLAGGIYLARAEVADAAGARALVTRFVQLR